MLNLHQAAGQFLQLAAPRWREAQHSQELLGFI